MENDNEYQDDTVKTVTPEKDGNGWSIQMGNGWSIWVKGDRCGTAPTEGETIRLYGKGTGYTVRGIVIGGRVYRYTSPEQAEVERVELCARLKREREENDAKFVVEFASLPPLPTFMIRDRDTWNKTVASNSSDGYRYACVQYAAAWANLMEQRMVGGDVASVAKQASHDADTDGITGFMYGAAVGVLSNCWEHGEQLRRWHNKDCAIDSEGDAANANGTVLNPALLSIG